MAIKEPLVLVPGLVCDGAVWAHQRAGLADVAECIVPDVAKPETIQGMATEVLNSAPERFAIAGFSMGGYIALEVLRQAPQRVTRLALIDSGARADYPDQTTARTATIRSVRSATSTPDASRRLRSSLPRNATTGTTVRTRRSTRGCNRTLHPSSPRPTTKRAAFSSRSGTTKTHRHPTCTSLRAHTQARWPWPESATRQPSSCGKRCSVSRVSPTRAPHRTSARARASEERLRVRGHLLLGPFATTIRSSGGLADAIDVREEFATRNLGFGCQPFEMFDVPPLQDDRHENLVVVH